MASVVVVHGIGQQHEGGLTLHSALFPALSQGLAFVGCRIGPDEVVFADYGVVFRPAGEVLSPEILYDWSDVTGDERELLAAWWERAAVEDPGGPPVDAEVVVRSPVWVQSALAALSGSRWLGGVSESLLVGDLKQVRGYLTDPAMRRRIRDRVASVVGPDTRVVVGHSLGSVVAYEVLCAHPEWPVRALVTLGSPLGLRRLIFDRLEPRPVPDGAGGVRGVWPGPGRTWTNIADPGDAVAAVADLRPLFGPAVRQVLVRNGAH